MDWEHLPRDQIIGMNERTAWVGYPKEEWLEGVHEAEKRTNQMTRATLSIIDNLVKEMNAVQILEKLEEDGKKLVRVRRICWFGIQLKDVYLNYLVSKSRLLQRSMPRWKKK